MNSILIWCDLNSEQDILEKMFGDLCVSIRGCTKPENKIMFEKQWRNGEVPILISKPKVFGWGMNWQHCNNMIFFGLSDSYEQFYQAVRRCWRFGQESEVNTHVIYSELEGAVVKNIQRKEHDAKNMSDSMVRYMSDITKAEIKSTSNNQIPYMADKKISLPGWLKETI